MAMSSAGAGEDAVEGVAEDACIRGAAEHAVRASAAGNVSAEKPAKTEEGTGGGVARKSATSELAEAEAAQAVRTEGGGTIGTRLRQGEGHVLVEEGTPQMVPSRVGAGAQQPGGVRGEGDASRAGPAAAAAAPVRAPAPEDGDTLPEVHTAAATVPAATPAPLQGVSSTPTNDSDSRNTGTGPAHQQLSRASPVSSSPAPTAPLSPQPHLLPSQGPVWEWAVLPDAPAVPVTTPDGHQILLPALMLVHRGSPSHSQSLPLVPPNPSDPPLLPPPSPYQMAHQMPTLSPLTPSHVPIPASQYGAMASYMASSPSPSFSPSPSQPQFPSLSPLSQSFTPHPSSAATPPAQPQSHHLHPTFNPHQSLHHSLGSMLRHQPWHPAPHTHPSPVMHTAYSPAGLPNTSHTHSHPTPTGGTPSPRAPHITNLGHAAAAHRTSLSSASLSPSPPPQPQGQHPQQQEPHNPWSNVPVMHTQARASHRPRSLPPTIVPTSTLTLHNQTLSRHDSYAHSSSSNTHYSRPRARASSLSSVYAGGVSVGAGPMTPRAHARAISRALMGSHPVNLDLSDLDEEEDDD